VPPALPRLTGIRAGPPRRVGGAAQDARAGFEGQELDGRVMSRKDVNAAARSLPAGCN